MDWNAEIESKKSPDAQKERLAEFLSAVSGLTFRADNHEGTRSVGAHIGEAYICICLIISPDDYTMFDPSVDVGPVIMMKGSYLNPIDALFASLSMIETAFVSLRSATRTARPILARIESL